MRYARLELRVLGRFAIRAMPFADDGPALRSDKVRPADWVAAFGKELWVPGWFAPGGMLTVHRPRLPGLGLPMADICAQAVSTIITHIK